MADPWMPDLSGVRQRVALLALEIADAGLRRYAPSDIPAEVMAAKHAETLAMKNLMYAGHRRRAYCNCLAVRFMVAMAFIGIQALTWEWEFFDRSVAQCWVFPALCLKGHMGCVYSPDDHRDASSVFLELLSTLPEEAFTRTLAYLKGECVSGMTLTVGESAAWLQVTPRQVRRMRERGALWGGIIKSGSREVYAISLRSLLANALNRGTGSCPN